MRIKWLGHGGLKGAVARELHRTRHVVHKVRKCIRCGDGRIAEPGICWPGSGVLQTESARAAAASRTGAEVFTTHNHCGAFKLAYAGKYRSDDDFNRACEDWGAREAARLGLRHKHLDVEGHPKLHHEAVVYYDAAGVLQPSDQLPAGFIVSRYCFAEAREHLKLYLRIAFSEQGLGFNQSLPLRIIIIADPHEPSRHWAPLGAEVREVVETLPLEQQAAITTEQIFAPRE